MRRIRVAQIGTNINSHASQCFKALCAHPDMFEVVGFCIVEDEKITCPNWRERFGDYPELTLEQILEDDSIEAVTVETDEIHLTKYAQMAAEHGKHIHMEKPGSQSVAAFERLVNTMRDSGKVFHTGYMYRYNPCVAELMRDVKARKYGNIFSVEAQMNCRHNEKVRSWLSNFKGGMMFFLGCHLVDLVMQIKGVPERVIPLNKSTGLDGLDVEDYGFAVLEYPDGCGLVKTSASEIGGFYRRQLVVSGERGMVELKPLELTDVKQPADPTVTGVRVSTDAENWFDEGVFTMSDPFPRYNGMLRAFGEYVRGEKENPYTLDYELALFKTIIKCCGGERNA